MTADLNAVRDTDVLRGMLIGARNTLAILYFLRADFEANAMHRLVRVFRSQRARIRLIENALSTPEVERMTHPRRGWSKHWQAPVRRWIDDVQDGWDRLPW